MRKWLRLFSVRKQNIKIITLIMIRTKMKFPKFYSFVPHTKPSKVILVWVQRGAWQTFVFIVERERM